jgi:hypothetical protein
MRMTLALHILAGGLALGFGYVAHYARKGSTPSYGSLMTTD